MAIMFDYDDWDDTEDLLLERPGSEIGYAAIVASLDVGDMPTVRQRQNDRLIKETEEGVVGLIAGGLEWFRSRGVTAAQLENKVRVYKLNNLGRKSQVTLAAKETRKAMQHISNPRKRTLDPEKVIG